MKKRYNLFVKREEWGNENGSERKVGMPKEMLFLKK